jgi:hypothetical protein
METKEIKTTRQLAALRQIHGAIEHLERSELECAVTLALAAETGLPPPADGAIPLYDALRERAPDLAIDKTFNLHRDWLKHWSEDKPDEIEISEFLAAIAVMRAVSKFYAVYKKSSVEMQSFGKWCRERKYTGA